MERASLAPAAPAFIADVAVSPATSMTKRRWLKAALEGHSLLLIHALWLPVALFALYWLAGFIRGLLGTD